MYSSREKNIIYNEILHPSHSEADLSLLLSIVPNHPRADRYRQNPARHYEKILYELLDHKTREEIRANRRKTDTKPAPAQAAPVDVAPKEKEPKVQDKPKAKASKAKTATTKADVVEKKSSKKKTNTP